MSRKNQQLIYLLLKVSCHFLSYNDYIKLSLFQKIWTKMCFAEKTKFFWKSLKLISLFRSKSCHNFGYIPITCENWNRLKIRTEKNAKKRKWKQKG